MEKRHTFTERFDWTLCLILFVFFLISCFSITSAQTTGQYNFNFVTRQIQWYVICSFIIAIIMYFDSEQIYRMTWFLYGIGILLLALLAVLPGSTAEGAFVPIRNGAKSWFQVPGAGLIQPSEFMKILLILSLSKMAVLHNQRIEVRTIKTDFWLFTKLGLLTLIPLAFVIKQPDLGTSLVIIAIFLGISLASGVSWKIIAPLVAFGVTLIGIIIYLALYMRNVLELFLDTYQIKRIYSWLQPELYSGKDSFQLEQSLSAIGSGMIAGKGYGERNVYVPELHTDFIFTVIGEEWGFIGASLVIGLFFILIFHLTKVALSSAEPYISYICAGVITMITFHVFQNIGMTIQVLPITGIPLPFISYGGSSLLGNMIAMGIIFGIQFHSKNYMFSNQNTAVENIDPTSRSEKKKKRFARLL
ncbi:rod shape-determining protein RodA [Bacillus sp. AGMB 02131]|uniref:Rod shape-determining protein RodA n=1 Tax=Peribacillus faecalis TaxID=2772559 RepID=A0A927CXS2_9BACI|nr:FtsW/RodA/SpoVE family cell cycle protein [Peribacillus faecalis]MBD3109683.1 rod shape-determining protein RodA [Peribacillus faecalis]